MRREEVSIPIPFTVPAVFKTVLRAAEVPSPNYKSHNPVTTALRSALYASYVISEALREVMTYDLHPSVP